MTTTEDIEAIVLHVAGVVQSSRFEVTAAVERGLPISSVQVLRDQGLSFSEVHGLVLPARTLKHRQDRNQLLSADEANKVMRVARIMTLADQVFGNHEKALGWLRRINKRLEGRTPLDMLKTELGADLVKQMLYQIDEGMFV